MGTFIMLSFSYLCILAISKIIEVKMMTKTITLRAFQIGMLLTQ